MVNIQIIGDEETYKYDIEMLVNQFYPKREDELNADNEELTISLSYYMKGLLLYLNAKLYKGCPVNKSKAVGDSVAIEDDSRVLAEASKEISVDYSLEELQNMEKMQRKSRENRIKNILKQLTYKVISQYTGKELPWGILTGIRPTKIAMSVLENADSTENIDDSIYKLLKEEYYVSDEKIKLATNIAKREKEILKNIDYTDGYSLYVGIPFCPTTCLYCSFTSYPIGRYEKKAEEYVDALIKEIEATATMMPGKKLNTIYFGGGTPTTLTAKQMDRVLTKIEECYDFTHLLEYTVEAGRPDSITRDKLEVLKKHGITRISVNPQTMKQETLDIIGRKHTVEQVVEAFNMAREVGFDNINMDFIVGLPNETIEDVRNNMEEVLKLNPDSITVHSLAIKRAARLNMFKEDYKEMTIENNAEIMHLCDEYAARMDMTPYYMYRQKNMAGNMENVGYAGIGKAGIYNILIMEEKQTIVALGAGSITKRVFPEGRIERADNVKNVEQYIERVDEMIERKRKLLA